MYKEKIRVSGAHLLHQKEKVNINIKGNQFVLKPGYINWLHRITLARLVNIKNDVVWEHVEEQILNLKSDPTVIVKSIEFS